MLTVFSLLDKARDLCGSDAALARALGVPLHHPNAWRAGRRTISPATVAMLGDLLQIEGTEVQRLAAEAIVNNAPPEKQGVLRRAFFALRETGAAFGVDVMTGIGGFAITALAAWSAGIEQSTMYTPSTRKHRAL